MIYEINTNPDRFDRFLKHLYIETLSGKTRSHSLVAYAVRCGRLEKPTQLNCVDCGNKASQYEHRNYGEPLNVDPVCKSCNIRRGPAKPVNPIIVYSLLMPMLSSMLEKQKKRAAKNGR